MEIKGLEKLKGKEIGKLNVRASRDEEGWHLDIFKISPEMQYDYDKVITSKRVKKDVIVDLAHENNCMEAEEVRNLYDKFLELYYTRRLHEILEKKRINEGIYIICPEVDTRKITLELTSYQLELIKDGVLTSIDRLGNDFNWDKNDPNNKAEFDLLNKIYSSNADNFKLNRICDSRLYDFKINKIIHAGNEFEDECGL